MTDLDGAVEQLARTTAARTTRRSFLGRAARIAVVVAGGPALATLLGDGVAHARVCGQSGVAPPCDTFDCDATWGWCWYANGCCAGGLLKKICDCCAPNTPNPVGYCPPGTRVLCIVESCGADPRLQTTTLATTASRDPVALSVAVSRDAFPGRVPMAVVGDAESVVAASAAASLGRVVAGPVLLTRRDGLAPEVAGELDRLGTEFVALAGPALAPGVGEGLSARGIGVQRVGEDPDPTATSVAAAAWSRGRTGSRRALVVLPGAWDTVIAGAGAVAALHRLPLLVGPEEVVRPALDAPRPVTQTFVVSGDPADAARFPGGVAVAGPTPEAQAAALADLLLDLGGVADTTLLAEAGDAGAAPGLALAGAPVVLHAPGTLDGARDWLFDRREGITALRIAGEEPVGLRRELQSILNEYEIHLLRGSAGQGLPVIPQPVAERPIGMARR
jgi:hypothetical protein